MQAGPSTAIAGPSTERTAHTHSQLWKWTLSTDAIAPCRIEDVFAMTECAGTKAGADADFFWLGRVPCRSVLFCGMVVGVQTYEQRTVYSVDDGSGMVDCNLRHSVQKAMIPHQSSPTKSKYRAATTSLKPPSTSRDTEENVKPVAVVGDIVRVVGRVLNRHHSRLINVDKLSVCKRATEEPEHWLTVAELHKTWYNPPNPAPFVIPPPKPRPPLPSATFPSEKAQAASMRPQVQSGKVSAVVDPSSPSKSSVASSAPSTPSSVASSHSKHPQSPIRLRHPSRLHTRDLTANTFRIYVKHYMDNAPAEPSKRARRASHASHCETSDEEEDDEVEIRLRRESTTPAKRKLGPSVSQDETPRAKRMKDNDSTPRASGVAQATRSTAASEHKDPAAGLAGFTLSHLRRVPELSLLAKRVVDAESKRRAKEERHKQKEQDAKSQGKTIPASKSARPLSKLTAATAAICKLGEPRAAKMKRLFRYAIRQLYEEGSIILWDGPVRGMPVQPIPAPSFVSAPYPPSTNKLWKTSASAANTTASSAFSSVSQANGAEDEDDAALSDPPEGEEAYVPLTSAYLAQVVEKAITTIMSRPLPTTGRKLKGPPPGPTPDEIVMHLRRRDERWARVGAWAVKDALEWARDKGRIWCIGDNRWEVCG